MTPEAPVLDQEGIRAREANDGKDVGSARGLPAREKAGRDVRGKGASAGGTVSAPRHFVNLNLREGATRTCGKLKT